MSFDLKRYQMHLAQARLDLASFDEAKHPRLHGKFVAIHKELQAIAGKATDKYASSKDLAAAASKLVTATGPKGNGKFDTPGAAKHLARNLRTVTWEKGNTAKYTELAQQIDQAMADDYDTHVGELKSNMHGTGYTPESLAQSRDIHREISAALQEGDPHVTVKIPSGSEMGMTYRQAHHLRHGRPRV